MTRSGDGAGMVWYAAYGSNLSARRFACYLRGGRPPGSTRTYRGARDQRLPRASVPVWLPLPLRFAGASGVWGGGVAVVGDRPAPAAVTLGRLYLVTREQFADVAAQENHLGHVTLPGPRCAVPRSFVCPAGAAGTAGPPGRYRLVVRCGERDRRPVLTVTAASPSTEALAAPGPAYTRTVADGLREAHGLGDDAIVSYLVSKPGVAGHWGPTELAAIVAGHRTTSG